MRPARLLFAVVLLFALPAAGQTFYREAPELQTRVARGELPPVERRLPRNPVLLQVEEAIGRYGGTWRMAMIGRGDGLLVYRNIGYEHLVRWDPAWRRVMPNVAQSFQVNENATVFTFQLRPGLRWSDGIPFTAEDVRFWFEDVLMDPDLAMELPRWMPRGRRGVRLEVEPPDLVRFVFDLPNSLFLASLAAGQDVGTATEFPQHALKRYHRRYNPAVEAEAKAAGFGSWMELFHFKARTNHNLSDPASLLRVPLADLAAAQVAEPVPTLDAWVVERRDPGNPARVVAVRNPYYWKVDPAGNQLPYIDRVEFLEVRSDDELKALLKAGVIGMQARHVSSLAVQEELPALMESGGYRPVTLLPSDSNVLPLAFNQTHPDPARRALLSDRDFRTALSLGIDRRAIIDHVLNGRGEPFQVAPRPESRHFSPRLARQHLVHDPAHANALLDGLGFTRRDAEGFRLDAQGHRLGVTVLTRRDRTHHMEALTMIAADWGKLGVEARVVPTDRRELRAAVAENRYEVATASGDGGMDAVLEAYAFIPLIQESFFAPAWVRWVNDPGEPGAEEPPASVLKQLALYDRIQETADPDQQARYTAEILDIAVDQFFQIGIATESPRSALARKDFRNVPRLMPESWLYPTPAPTNPAQYFMVQPKED